MNETIAASIDWVAVSGFIGLILPVIIELFAKKISGKAKILVVWGCCIVCAVAQHGMDGGFSEWNWGQFLTSAVIIITIAVNSWNQMWKKWFPTDPDPISVNNESAKTEETTASADSTTKSEWPNVADTIEG